MRARRWLIVALALAGLLLDLFALTDFASGVGAGITTKDTLVPGAFQTVSSVLDGGAVQRAGIRAGDRVTLASAADARILGAHTRGAVVRFVRPDGAVVPVVLTTFPQQLNVALLIVNGILLSLLSLVLVLRAWNDVQARRLAFGCAWLSFLFLSFRFSGPAQIVTGTFSDALTAAGIPAFIFFATGWDATPPRLGRVLRRIGVFAAIGFAVCAIPLDVVPLITPLANPPPIVAAGGKITVIFTLLMCGALAAGLIASVGRARGRERRRLGWISVTLVVTFGLWSGYSVCSTFGLIDVVPVWLALASLALPAGFAYAMLRHRLIDLGFALNRTAVFAATTLLLAGLFGGLQWAVNQLLSDATRREGFIAQLIVAVVVLYIVRIARSRTESFIAQVFFAARRRRIDAIAGLATEIDALDDPAALAPFVERALRERAQLTATVTFGEASSPAGGTTVFPLRIRGRERGVLTCVLPPDEDLAPDESAALRTLATAVAIVRDDLLAAALRDENARLHEQLAQLRGEPQLVRPGGAAATPSTPSE
jgi:hypothetical protein